MSKAPTPKPDAEDEAVRSYIAELSKGPYGDHAFHAMVKPAEAGDGLMVAHLGDCDSWTQLPTGAIRTVKAGRDIHCKGHTHATATIQLKAPQSELEKAFAGLASLHLNRISQLSASAGSDNCNPRCGEDEHCVWDDQAKTYICQPGV